VAELIRKEVGAVNKGLPEHLRIKRFVLLYKLLDADDDELTRTGKVRRKFIMQRYQPLVDALYSHADKVRVDTEFRYQDGSVQKVSVEVRVLEAEGKPELVGV